MGASETRDALSIYFVSVFPMMGGIWSFNASSTLTRQENGIFEIDFFFNAILSKTGCMDAATMYSRSIGIFYLVFIWIWSISATLIQQNTTTFSSLLKVKGNNQGGVLFLSKLEKPANTLFSSAKQNLELCDKMDQICLHLGPESKRFNINIDNHVKSPSDWAQFKTSQAISASSFFIIEY